MSVKKKYRQNQIAYYHIHTGVRIVLIWWKAEYPLAVGHIVYTRHSHALIGGKHFGVTN
jgi:hypothetical protein